MPRNPEIRSVIVDEKGRMASDVACSRCQYNLRGVQQTGVCPECGLAVERAILAGNDPRWTKLQIVLSILAIAHGIVLPIVNFAVYQYSWNTSVSLWPHDVLATFIAMWLTGGLVWLIALAVAALNRRFTRTCLLVMIAVLAETVIAVVINAVTWGTVIASI